MRFGNDNLCKACTGRAPQVHKERATLGLMVDIINAVSLGGKSGGVPFHGCPMKPKLLPVERGRLVWVSKEQVVFDENDVLGLGSHCRMVLKQLMWKYDETSVCHRWPPHRALDPVTQLPSRPNAWLRSGIEVSCGCDARG